jgi:hypothetical protein
MAGFGVLPYRKLVSAFASNTLGRQTAKFSCVEQLKAQGDR